MSALSGRKINDVRRGFECWAASQGDEATVIDIAQPSAGYSSEIFMIDFEQQVDDQRQRRSVVLRLGPHGAGTQPSYDLRAQVAAQRAAAQVGVPVAEPLRLVTDATWLGAPFLVMAKVEGHIVDDAVGHDPWIRSLGERDQRRLYEGFVDQLSVIHNAKAEDAIAGGVVCRTLSEELDRCEAYLYWSAPNEPLPQLTAALAWCRATVPSAHFDEALLWGDVRLANVVLGDDLDIRAVLDWDMTSVGAREHDIAWLTQLDTTMSRLMGTRAPGLLTRNEIMARYERLSGHELQYFEWFETFAMLRSTALMTRIGYLQRAADVRLTFPIEDNPLLDLLLERL